MADLGILALVLLAHELKHSRGPQFFRLVAYGAAAAIRREHADGCVRYAQSVSS